MRDNRREKAGQIATEAGQNSNISGTKKKGQQAPPYFLYINLASRPFLKVIEETFPDLITI